MGATSARYLVVRPILANQPYSPKPAIQLRFWRRFPIISAICIVLMTSSYFFLPSDFPAVANFDSCCGSFRSSSCWAGFSSIDRLIVFGDSWSSTFFDVNGTQPSPSSPLGNPDMPDDNFGRGSTWPTYLATVYNESRIEAYNFASNGASVDERLRRNEFSDFISQRSIFQVNYEPMQQLWRPSSTLYAIFFGINDLHGTEGWVGEEELHIEQLNQYLRSLDLLYESGAKNFLIINVPPLGRAMIGSMKLAAEITEWNQRLHSMMAAFRTHRPGVDVFEFDMFSFFNRIIDEPTFFSETKDYQILTNICNAYTDRDWELESKDESCEYKVGQYLWHNGLHPTPPMQKAMAARIAGLLKGEDSRFDVLRTRQHEDSLTQTLSKAYAVQLGKTSR